MFYIVNTNVLSYLYEDTTNIYYLLTSEIENSEDINDYIISVHVDVKPILLSSFGTDIDYSYCIKLEHKISK